MNGLRLLIIIMITTSLLPACDEVERGNNMGLTLIPFQEKAGGRWGFIDLKGNVAIEPDFKEKPSIFSEGFAIIKIIKSDEIYYDYINIEGKEMEQRFSYATRFNEGLALVIEENKAPFYIDKDMHTVFTLNDAEEAGVFSEGLAKFKDEEGEWGFVDKAGEVVIKPRYNYVSAYREGLALVTIESEDEDGGKIVEIGFINKNNKEVIKISDRY
ncbi:MAG: WG repeat-containing protein, partial [Bacteroidetes bacterium]|nr:WG repeat-containing protein [Bacteroidota bacterium]